MLTDAAGMSPLPEGAVDLSNAKYFNRLLVGFRDIAKFWSILYLNSRMGMRQSMTGSQWIEIACCVFENLRQSVDGLGVKIFPRSHSIE